MTSHSPVAPPSHYQYINAERKEFQIQFSKEVPPRHTSPSSYSYPKMFRFVLACGLMAVASAANAPVYGVPPPPPQYTNLNEPEKRRGLQNTDGKS